MSEVTRLTLSAYRLRDAGEERLLAHFHREIGLLRARGHITSRPAAVCRTDRGEYLVVSEWATPGSVDDAHADPDVVAVWEDKAQLVEYLAPAELERSDVPFVSYDVVATI